GGLRERLDLGAERVLLREVLGPHRFALREVGVAAREELVTRGAEAFPERLLLPARDRADRLPIGLELLDLVGGLDPVGGGRQRFGPLAERHLLRQVLGADAGLRREVCLAL